MPDILLRISGQNTSSAAIDQAAASLSALDRAMAGVVGSGSKVEAALRSAAGAQSSLVSAMNAVSAAQARQVSDANRAALALDNYTRLSERLNAATGDTTRLQDQVQRAFTTSVTASDRAAESVTRLANAYATLDQRQARAATATNKLTEPIPPAGSSSGHGSAIGSALKNVALYGGLYQGGYLAVSAAEQSVSRNAQYSRLLGTTQGFTGGSAADQAEINRYVQGLAGQGTLPFSPLQLLTSYYGLASADIYGGTKTTEQIATRNAQVAAASGDVDPTGTNAAILALIGAYNQNGPGVAGAAASDLNQLTAGVIKGQLTFADFASVIPRAKASIGKAAGVSSGDLIAYLSAESNVGISADQGAKDFGSLVQQLVRPNSVQQRVAKASGIDLSSGFLSRDGGLSGFLQLLQTRTAGLTEAQRATFFAGLLDNKAAGGGLAAVLGDTRNQGIFPYVANANQADFGKGAAQAAIDAYNATPGAKLANAEAQFNTALDNLTKSALPALTTAAVLAAEALAALPGVNGWLDKAARAVDLPGKGAALDKLLPGGTTGLLALANFTPAGPLFDALKGASLAMANHPNVQGGGSAPSAGTGSSTSTIVTVPANYAGPLLPNMRRAQPTIVDSYRAPGTVGAALSAADAQRLALAGVAAATTGAAAVAVHTAATSHTARFINAPGIGALEAGVGSTAVRFAGQLDPEATELRQLRQENSLLRGVIAADNAKIITYLGIIANQGKVLSYPPNKQVSAGGGRSYKG